MTEERRRLPDIEPQSSRSGPDSQGRAEQPGDPFRFNFLPEDPPALQEERFLPEDPPALQEERFLPEDPPALQEERFLPEDPPALQGETRPPPAAGTEPGAAWTPGPGQGSAFAFHFEIPPVEDMETTEPRDSGSPSGRPRVPEEPPALLQEVNSTPEPSAQSQAKKKKKKKSGKKNVPDGAEAQQSPAEGSRGGEDAELSAEQQLNRQLDWCIEQLESGMLSQRATPKQKEEASRSLKTLRSSKAPLAKKRQVMRAMTGDYRKKMDEEKSKQYKLIQNEIASAKVKVVSNSPKKSSFHRRAEAKKQPAATEEDLHAAHLHAAHLDAAHLDAAHLDAAHLHAAHLHAAQGTHLKTQTQEETPAFVFTSSKEEFHFNFL
ncbi:UPF0488 protein C8orf33 [Liparis tanakae]|uniref:UPF0488 protein C8orf33 n=1 Tax=Liparis tanakae TaxID=230148 RepID=A0A4Z2FFM3_9TELE|nr:UPF0488 protein C8orf33 [Liparis tanakae]